MARWTLPYGQVYLLYGQVYLLYGQVAYCTAR